MLRIENLQFVLQRTKKRPPLPFSHHPSSSVEAIKNKVSTQKEETFSLIRSIAAVFVSWPLSLLTFSNERLP